MQVQAEIEVRCLPQQSKDCHGLPLWKGASMTTQGRIEKMEIHIYMDGASWCALLGHPRETNIQDSPAGFGDTPKEALKDLLDNWED